MRVDETDLYENFVRARQEAMELTDRYNATPLNAADRDVLWEQVVRQTETARVLLEAWLDASEGGTLPSPAAPEPAGCLISTP